MVGTLAITEAKDLKEKEIEVEEELSSRVKEMLKIPEDKIVVRDSLPKTDFGLDNEDYSKTLSEGWQTFIDTTIADNRFVGIYGIGRKTTNFTLVRFTVGTDLIDIVNTEHAGLDSEIPVKVLEKPIYVNQNIPLKIDLFVTAAGAVRCILFSKTAEPSGKVISPV